MNKNHKKQKSEKPKNDTASAKSYFHSSGTKGKQKENDDRPFYKILGVPKDASTSLIERSYKSMAIKVHPDKNIDDPNSTENFQKLQLAFETLRDPDKRAHYDQFGSEEENTLDFKSAYEFYRKVFPRINTDEIEEYCKNYPGSEEETQDLIRFYNRFKGDVSDLLKWVPLSEPDQIDRYLEILTTLIDNKKLDKYKDFDTTIKKLRKNSKSWSKLKEKESKMITASKKKPSESSFDELVLKIRHNQKNKASSFGALIESIEEREKGKENKRRKYKG